MSTTPAGPTPPSPEALLAALDAEQRTVATTLLGPVAVLAGAGTGKTRAITHRIAYGVATGTYSPAHVLALTFTTRAAGELRSRLRALGAGSVQARTFHAAAMSQLSYFWPDTVGGHAPKIVESKARMIAHAADTIGMHVDKPVLRDLAAEVEWRKVQRLTLDEYEAAAVDRVMPRETSPARVIDLMRAYERLKDDRRQMDFEDVLLATLGMVETEPRVASYVRQQYRFFVVDEYQDVSPVQHDLLRAWLGDRQDLCVVGDASQTIYSFAGASSKYLLGFGSEFPRGSVLRLERNYRSTREVVNAANALMRGRPGALDLAAQDPVPGPEPVVVPCVHDGDEAATIARRITDLVSEGGAYGDCAVLFRVGAQSAALEAALGRSGIPYRVQGGTRFFDRPEVKLAVHHMRGEAIRQTDDELTRRVGLVLQVSGWTPTPPEGTGAVREQWDALQAIMGLAEDAPAGTTMQQFTQDLVDRAATHHEPELDAVTLATLHSSKGLEWPNVVIAGAAEGLLPISHATTDAEVDEERRLFYVGLTRARRTVTITWSRQGSTRGGARAPSRFLAAIDTHTGGAAAPADATR
ncbi:Rep family ATP-dependent DNA helicase [Curtobacterium sp. PhB130]|uniref:ATP-dependent helicase n=1 Tax=unclassified Curtobacterium TaxID=257496 RepID=UPI000F4CA78B|nr:MULTISPECIES: ATP-dependent helicase [unclassified Curtobacterium]ROP64619.1 Rep family ATP-dependent DNA helicase [Curtobacterium sp. ZW137]ROS74918.1 Rep family ATP-dependent DNA helicase [Curtobacterium sp. PhB130]TCK63532.1 Rep family ATP-dependent DNA helicase [Curtobacterium sp. PhB136]